MLLWQLGEWGRVKSNTSRLRGEKQIKKKQKSSGVRAKLKLGRMRGVEGVHEEKKGGGGL